MCSLTRRGCRINGLRNGFRRIYCGRCRYAIVVILAFCMLEYTVGFAAAARFRFPVALDFAARFFNDHMPIWAFCIQTLAYFPFWAHLLVTKGQRFMPICTHRTLQSKREKKTTHFSLSIVNRVRISFNAACIFGISHFCLWATTKPFHSLCQLVKTYFTAC